MIHLAIIGAGQLGSRHLQALANLKKEAIVQVVDPSADALKIAESRFNEVSQNFKGQISFHTSISELEKDIDVAIIATNSKVRRGIVEQLTAHSSLKNIILEKFLFTKERDYYDVEEILAKRNINAWVNCPRRLMDFYKQLRAELTGNIHFSLTGNSWGMGCNGIHLLDLFAFLTKTPAITLTNNFIDEGIIESKRAGYIEFTGTITGHANKHTFRITSFSGNGSPSQMSIHTANARYSIEEGTVSKVWSSKAENNWIWEENTFKMPFQSQLTNIVVDDILENGTCELTSYQESATLHVLFLKNLLSFLRKINNDNSINECLIT